VFLDRSRPRTPFRQLSALTAQQLNLNEVLIVATNSTGGVMGR
jgi:L-lactate permease